MQRSRKPRQTQHTLAVALTGALLATALKAQAAPITLSHQITVTRGAPYFGTYTTTAFEPLTVTRTGSIIAPPDETAIGLQGDLVNGGTIRAAFGVETFGLALGGANNDNDPRALIEAHFLTLPGTGTQSLVNRGTVVTGAYTLDDGRLATHAALAAGAYIGERASVFNEFAGAGNPGARWTSYGDIKLQGSFGNEQTFELKRNAVLLPGSNPDLYRPTLFINMPLAGTLQAQLNNSGIFQVGTGTSVRNDGLIRNSGFMALDWASSLFNNLDQVGLPGQRVVGRLENTGLFVHHGYALSRGEVVTSGSLTIKPTGWWVDEGSFTNTGTLVIDGGGEWSTSSWAVNSAVATWTVAGLAQVLPGGQWSNAGQLDVAPGGRVVIGAGSTLFTGLNPEGAGLLTVSGRLDVAGRLLVNGDTTAASGTQAPGLEVLRGGIVEVTGGGLAPGGPGIANGVTGEGRIVNEGEFLVRSGGTVSVREFDQRDGQLLVEAGATLATVDGRLLMTGGRLSGQGRINGDVFVQGSSPVQPNDPTCPSFGPLLPGIACFTPGSSPGHMDIDGELTLGEGAVLELEIERDAAGLLHWDTVSAGAMSFLQGSMIRVLIADSAPGAGTESLPFLGCLAGACDFSGASFEVRGGQGGAFSFGSDGSLGFELAPIPEPGTWALMLAGIAAVGWTARRRAA